MEYRTSPFFFGRPSLCFLRGFLNISLLKPIFHQAFFGRVRAGNAMYFALGTFQIFFSQTKRVIFLKSMCRFIKQNPKFMFLILSKIPCRIGTIICVTCTFHLHWSKLPPQSIDDAQWNIALKSAGAIMTIRRETIQFFR